MTFIHNYKKQAGRKYRKNKRLERELKTQGKGISVAEQLIEKYQFNSHAVIDKEIYKQTLSLINQDISKILKKGKESLFARTVIRDKAQEILNVHKLDVALPAAQTVLGTIKSAYTFSSANKAAALHRWDKSFNELIKNRKCIEKLSKTDWAALAAYSFMRHSLHLNSHMVSLFVEKICGAAKPFEYQDSSVWVNIISPAPRRFKQKLNYHGHTCFNLKIKTEGEEPKLALSKSMPLNLCTTILAKKAMESSGPHPLHENSNTLFTLIRTTLFGENFIDKNIRNINELCEAIDHKVIICEDSGISPMLSKISCHLIASVCLNPINWASLSKPPQEIPNSFRPGDLTKRNNPNNMKKQNGIILGDFYEDFEKATQVDDSTPETLKSLRTKLKKMIEQKGVPLSMLIMIQWVGSLSDVDPARKFGKKKALAPRTIRDYGRLFASRWILAVGDDDISDYTAEDFIEVYEQMINEVDQKINDPQDILPSLIARFNDYIGRKQSYEDFTKMDLPENFELASIMGGRGKKSLFIRARIISHQHVSAILNHLDQLSFHSEQFKLITIIAWRCGLRIGEILKLRPCDYEFGWLYVRKNRYGFHKSHSAARRVNLKKLLSGDEHDEFVVLWTKMLSAGPEGLLFSPGFNLKWDGPKVSKFITALMRQVSGDEELVFHSFRHTAASMVSCIIEDAWDIAQKISGHPKEKLEEIKKSIVGINRLRDKYTCLAVFLGHANVLETMRRYCHLSPFILQSKLSQQTLQMPKELVYYLGGITTDKNLSTEKSWNKHLAEANPHLFTFHDSMNNNATVKISKNTDKKAIISDVHSFIKWIEEGKSYSIGLKHFQLSDEVAKRHLRNAIYLYYLLSRRGGHRLFPNKRKRVTALNGVKFLLTPSFLSNEQLQKQVYTAIDKWRDFIQEVYGKERNIRLKSVRKWCETIISKATSNSELSVADPEIALFMINAAGPALKKDNWDITIFHYDHNEEEVLEIWKDIIKLPNAKNKSLGSSKQTPKNENGFAHLSYKPDANNPDELAYKIPVILSHMLMIMIGQEDDFIGLNVDKEKAEQLLENLTQT